MIIVINVTDVNSNSDDDAEKMVFLVAVERAKSRPMSAGEL